MKWKIMSAVVINVAAVASAMAFTIPATDSFAYPVYDTTMSIINGPLGFVLALLCVAWGARQFIHYNYAEGPPHFGLSPFVPLGGIVYFLVAAFLLHAENWMVSLGALV